MGNNNRRENTNTKPMKYGRIKKRPCSLCAAGIEEIDYKDIPTLRRNMTDRGKIAPRRASGLCPRHQRAIAHTIKKARVVGLVPNVLE